MKTIEYLKPFSALLEWSKGKMIEEFVISNAKLIAVQNKKNIEILYNGVSFYNNFGRQSMTISDIKKSLQLNSEKVVDFNSTIQNWCNKQLELPIKEKIVINKPKKVYHSFTNFKGSEIQNLKGICVNTFEVNGIDFEVFRHKKVDYICFDYYAVSNGSIDGFKSNIILYDYSESKIKSWIEKMKLERE